MQFFGASIAKGPKALLHGNEAYAAVFEYTLWCLKGLGCNETRYIMLLFSGITSKGLVARE